MITTWGATSPSSADGTGARGPAVTADTFADASNVGQRAQPAGAERHPAGGGLAQVTDEGWSLRRVRERFLKGACTIVRHARQVVNRIVPSKSALWRLVAEALRQPMMPVGVAA